MKAYDAVKLFSAQITRSTGCKTILAPSPLKEPGPHVRVVVRKVVTPLKPKAAQSEREIRLYVSVDGSAESETGLRMALETCEALSDYLSGCTRLEDQFGAAISSTRVTSRANEDDGILEDPDNGNVAWLDDLHFVTLFIPA